MSDMSEPNRNLSIASGTAADVAVPPPGQSRQRLPVRDATRRGDESCRRVARAPHPWRWPEWSVSTNQIDE